MDLFGPFLKMEVWVVSLRRRQSGLCLSLCGGTHAWGCHMENLGDDFEQQADSEGRRIEFFFVLEILMFLLSSLITANRHKSVSQAVSMVQTFVVGCPGRAGDSSSVV